MNEIANLQKVICLICQNPSVHINPDGRMEEHRLQVPTCSQEPKELNKTQTCLGSSTQHYVAEGDEFVRVFGMHDGSIVWTLLEVLTKKWPMLEEHFRILRSNDLCALRDGKLVWVEEKWGIEGFCEICGQTIPLRKTTCGDLNCRTHTPVQSPAEPTDGEVLAWLDRNAFRIEVRHGEEIETLYSSILSNWKHPSHAILHAMQQEQQAK